MKIDRKGLDYWEHDNNQEKELFPCVVMKSYALVQDRQLLFIIILIKKENEIILY